MGTLSANAMEWNDLSDHVCPRVRIDPFHDALGDLNDRNDLGQNLGPELQNFDSRQWGNSQVDTNHRQSEAGAAARHTWKGKLMEEAGNKIEQLSRKKVDRPMWTVVGSQGRNKQLTMADRSRIQHRTNSIQE